VENKIFNDNNEERDKITVTGSESTTVMIINKIQFRISIPANTKQRMYLLIE
jgi:hypothetical protein